MTTRSGGANVAIFLGVAAIAPTAFAQRTGGATAETPAPAIATATATARAIAQVAGEIARGLGPVPAGTLVAASPVASDVPAPKGEELAVRIAGHVAGRAGAAKAHEKAASLSVARGNAGRAASLVYLQIEIAKGELRVTADLYPLVSNGWERLRNPAPGPRAHAFAAAPLDAEVRAFLAPIVLEQAQLHKAKHEEGEVLAVACGDVDGDGGLELVLVSRSRVSIGKLRGGKFVATKTAPWSALASRAPVPLREPLASVVVTRSGEILVGSTDRGAVAVDGSLVVRRQLSGLPVPGAEGSACSVATPESGSLDGDAVACAAPARGAPSATLPAPAARYDAIAKLDAVARDGSVSELVAAREPSGKLRVRRQDAGGKPVEITADGAGAQIALADLDLDGAPELVTTTESDADTIVVSTVGKSGMVARVRFPAKDGVRALAACPPEERGVPAIVAVVGPEVWLVR